MVLSPVCKEMNLTDTDNAESQELSRHGVDDVVNELSASDQPLFNTIIRSRLGLDIAVYLVIPRAPWRQIQFQRRVGRERCAVPMCLAGWECALKEHQRLQKSMTKTVS